MEKSVEEYFNKRNPDNKFEEELREAMINGLVLIHGKSSIYNYMTIEDLYRCFMKDYKVHDFVEITKKLFRKYGTKDLKRIIKSA